MKNINLILPKVVFPRHQFLVLQPYILKVRMVFKSKIIGKRKNEYWRLCNRKNGLSCVEFNLKMIQTLAEILLYLSMSLVILVIFLNAFFSSLFKSVFSPYSFYFLLKLNVVWNLFSGQVRASRYVQVLKEVVKLYIWHLC